MDEPILCGDCPSNDKTYHADIRALNQHYRYKHAFLSTFNCGYCEAVVTNKTSLVRHIKASHSVILSDQNDEDRSFVPTLVQNIRRPLFEGLAGQGSCNDGDTDGSQGMCTSTDDIQDDDPLPIIDLNKIASEVLVDLRSRGTLTGKAIERFQAGCMKLLKCQHTDLVTRFSELLLQKGMAAPDIEELVKEVGNVKDVFAGMKTTDEQLEYFEREYGLVQPVEYYLGPRLDRRLDPKTNAFVQTEVHSTFEYIPFTESLEAIMNNRTMRNNIFKDFMSMDGVLRSYVDGSHFKDHPFLTKHQNVLHILLFFDELEVASALGSKTTIHKLGVFLFQVLNLPAHLGSRLSSIHLLALAYAEDLKKPGAFKKVLTPFILEMKRLSSDAGVDIFANGELFVLRAVLVAFSADTLAAHDLLGFISPSAHLFCRMCMIHRRDFRQDGNALAPLRTKEDHDEHVRIVELDGKASSRFGVKRSCPLNEVPFFHCVEGSVFDAFHDVLEGVAPLVIKLVLRHFVIKCKAFKVQDFNVRVSSFPYGIPDSKNKPSANFVREMFTTRKALRQGGCQIWCLMRALPFLICDGIQCSDEDAQHMEVVFLLQDIMKIIFAFELTPEDLDRLDTLTFRFINHFKSLYVDTPFVVVNANVLEREGEEVEDDVDDLLEEVEEEEEEQQQEEEGNESDPDDDGAEVDNDNEEFERAQGRRRRQATKPMKVHLINKIHHMKHYGEMMRRYGPAVRLWCAKFEGRLKIFRQHSAICCNFTKVPKTMARMFQLANVLQESDGESSLEFQKGETVTDPAVFHLLGLDDHADLAETNGATYNGEDYRRGLFISLLSAGCYPKFALITNIYVYQSSSVYLCVKPWKVLCLSAKFNCYRVEPDEESVCSAVNVDALHNFRAIAPWSVTENDYVYLSTRTIFL